VLKVQFEALGAAKIRLIGLALRRLGADRQIVNDMAKEIRRSGPAIRREVRAHILAELPKSGGLNEWVARAPVRLVVRRGANTAGVSVRVGRNSRSGRADLKGLDAGGVRHPLWGNRKHWYGQAVTPGSISEGISEEGSDALERAVEIAAGFDLSWTYFSIEHLFERCHVSDSGSL
jgi:hypothetical protein